MSCDCHLLRGSGGGGGGVGGRISLSVAAQPCPFHLSNILAL